MSTTGSTSSDSITRAPRSDGIRNREKLIDAAESVFAELGVLAPLDEVARVAGLSSGTFYRHFSDRTELFWALNQRIAAEADRIQGVMRAASDPGEVIEIYMYGMTEVLVEFPATRAILAELQKSTPDFVPGQRYEPFIAEATGRAKKAGILDETVQPADLIMVSFMVASLGTFAGVRDTGLWRRYLAIALAGLRPGRFTAEESNPGPDTETYRRMMR
jgi:AcrR family transcriptional regulator